MRYVTGHDRSPRKAREPGLDASIRGFVLPETMPALAAPGLSWTGFSDALLRGRPVRDGARRMTVTAATPREGADRLRNLPFDHADLAGVAVGSDVADLRWRRPDRPHCDDRTQAASDGGRQMDKLGERPGERTNSDDSGNSVRDASTGTPGSLHARTIPVQTLMSTMDCVVNSRKET